MRRRVDIFIPASQPPAMSQPVLQQSLHQSSTPTKPAKTAGVDVIALPKKPALNHLRPWYTPHRPQPAKTTVVSLPTVSIQPPKRAVGQPDAPSVPQSKPAKKHRLRTALLLVLGGVAVLVAGNLLQSALFGELLVGTYAVFALLRRIESRTTFMLALVSLGCIVLLLLVRPDAELMRNFAIYAFLFLLIGTLSLAREVRQ